MKKGLNVGDSVSISNIFTCEDVHKFSIVSKDTNPIHLDEAVAADSIFGQRVVHGALVASLFSGLLGVQLPGEGSIYLGQTLSFKAPVFINEQVTASVEVVEIREGKSIAKLRTLCVNDKGVTVVDGEAIVKFA
ncbi:MAG: MaoC family dehydratase [Pseudomonadales bacterium]